jgi:hypothetical protein
MDTTVAQSHPVRAIALVAAIGALIEAAFQAAIALGAPFGRAAWGGQATYPDDPLRVASGVAVVMWLFAAAVLLRRGGYEIPRISAVFARRATWVIFAFLVLGTVMNLASRSGLERSIWTPFSLVLAVLTFFVARGSADGSA